MPEGKKRGRRREESEEKLPEREEREESTTALHHRAVTQSHVSTIEQGRSGTPDFPPLYHSAYLYCFSIVPLLPQYQILQGWISHASGLCFQASLFIPRFYLTFHVCDEATELSQLIRSGQMCETSLVSLQLKGSKTHLLKDVWVHKQIYAVGVSSLKCHEPKKQLTYIIEL